MWQLGLALSVLCIGAALLRERCVFGVAATLLVNWTVNTVFVRVAGDVSPWGFFLATDYVSGVFVISGLAVICGRFTLASIIIALSYAAECVLHAAYGLSDHGAWATYRYWWATLYIAVGQMMFVFGWGAYELARRIGRARRRVPFDPARVARGSGASAKEQ